MSSALRALSTAVRPRSRARHAKPSVAAPMLVAGGMTAALAVTDGALLTGAATAGGTQSQWEALAQCESGGNWSINTGNGYYGGLQFNLATWRGLGLGGYPHQASASQQIAAGMKLHDQRGWQPWPACSRKLGLAGGGATVTAPAPAPVAPAPVAPAPVAPAPAPVAPVAAAPVAAAAPAPAPAAAAPAAAPRREAAARASRSRSTGAPRIVAAGTAAPAFDGRTMTVADVRTYRPAVLQWQSQMKARGWKLTADGFFGPQSASVAQRFVAEKGLSTRPGTVDATAWNAAWAEAVSRR